MNISGNFKNEIKESKGKKETGIIWKELHFDLMNMFFKALLSTEWFWSL